jgi:hypothetical protein
LIVVVIFLLHRTALKEQQRHYEYEGFKDFIVSATGELPFREKGQNSERWPLCPVKKLRSKVAIMTDCQRTF